MGSHEKVYLLSVDLGDRISVAIGSTLKDEEMTSRSFRNPFDITRCGLLGQLARMRTNFLHSTPTTPNLIEEGEPNFLLMLLASSSLCIRVQLNCPLK